MNRIKSILFLIDETDTVVDVGCDQALLSIMLAKKGIKSIASDLRKNIIDNARKKINELKLNEYIDLRVGNGLESIKENEANTLVLSGMGTFTILEILKNTNIKFNKIITVSNNNHSILRDKMNTLGYKVLKEQIIIDRNKYYNIIVFVPGTTKYTKKELLLGLNHIDENMYLKYKDFLLKKYNKILKKSKDKNDKLLEIVKLLK